MNRDMSQHFGTPGALLRLLFLFFIPVYGSAQQKEPEVTLSDKEGGRFVSNLKVEVKAPYKQTQSVLNKFAEQYCGDLDGLFRWALSDLKLKGEKDDMISINLKSHTCMPGQAKMEGLMDMYVSILRKDFRDCTFETTIDLKEEAGKTLIAYEMPRCDNVIEHVNARLTALCTGENSSELTFEVAFKAQNPYNLMSKKQYRENIEWRFVKFLSNLRDEAERHF